MLSLSLLYLLISNNKHYIVHVLTVLVYVTYQSLYLLDANLSSHLLFNGYSTYDNLSISLIFIGAVLCIWLLSVYISNSDRTINNELVGLFILLLISLAALVSTNSNLTMIVAIELQSLVLYILFATSINNTSTGSQISLSYLINAAIATALLLFGVANNSTVLMVIAILWKLGVMPVHVWSLPVLDNLHSLLVASYLTLTKFGTLIVLGLIASSTSISSEILMYTGILNLTLGNIMGLLQYRYQRIITYSSLIQIGYILLVLSDNTSISLTYFELYSLYTVLLLILWALPTVNVLHAGTLLSNTQLLILILVLYTVAGLPFMPLFWTKLDILLTINVQSVAIALISTLLSSLIYIRLIKYISFNK